MFLKKYKAFTLIELLMVMVLTTLFSILAFYSYQLIHQQYLVYKRQNEKMEVHQRFSSLIFQDFRTAQVALINGNTLQLDNSLTYLFQDSLVQRLRNKENYRDTFFVKTTLATFSFENKLTTNGLIDYGQINIDFFEQNQIMTLHKKYSAFDLITYQKQQWK